MVTQQLNPNPSLRRTTVAGVVALIALAVLAVPAAEAAPKTLVFVLGAVIAVGIVAVTAWRPVIGTYIYVVTLPLLAGIERGNLLPLVRPNEAVLALVVLGALGAWVYRWLRTGVTTWPAPHPVDGPLAVFVLLATVWPIAWMMLRGLTPGGSDLSATLPLLKLAALFLLVRVTVRTDAEVVRLLRMVVWPSVAVAVIAVVQVLKVGPVLAVLSTLWSDGQGSASDIGERGSTTLGNPIATGDVLVIALVVVICCGIRGLLGRRERLVAGVVLVVGILATAQVSAWLSAVIAGIVILARFTTLRRRALRFWPVPVIAVVLAIPPIITRTQDTTSVGVPVSWATRWDNLTHYYLPALGDFRFLLGVGPNSVLQAQETWRDVIYLESGYLEFLWDGGIPLLAAFGLLTIAVLRTARAAAALRGPRGAVGEALRVAWWTIVASSLLDAHLTLRGTGDLLFVMLALVVGHQVLRPGAGSPTSSFPATGAVPSPRTSTISRGEPATPMIEAWSRRAIDVAGASLGLLLVAIPMLIISVAVRLDSDGPAFLRQRRVGIDQRSFVLLKFRTMHQGTSDAALRALIAAELRGEDTSVGGSTKLSGDARVTRVGAWLRKLSLDELPQLINVLRGEMSLVGPRPCLEWEAPMFPAHYGTRFDVRPGLTGLWQVEGRSTMGTLEMLELDVAYVRDRADHGLRRDLSILARTVPALVRGDGAR